MDHTQVPPDNFVLKETEVPAPKDGEALLELQYLSVDPYMRGRMRNSVGYFVGPYVPGECMSDDTSLLVSPFVPDLVGPSVLAKQSCFMGGVLLLYHLDLIDAIFEKKPICSAITAHNKIPGESLCNNGATSVKGLSVCQRHELLSFHEEKKSIASMPPI